MRARNQVRATALGEENTPVTAAEVVGLVAARHPDHDPSKLAKGISVFLSQKKKDGLLTGYETAEGVVLYSINR